MGPIISRLLTSLSKPAVQHLVARAAYEAFRASQRRRKSLSEWTATHSGPTRFRLAVLGESETGKTTLINSWQGTWQESPPHTRAPVRHGDIKVTRDGFVLIFEAVTDVGGNRDQLPNWDDLVADNRYVLYLVDARRLAEEPTGRQLRDRHRLEEDAERIQHLLVKGRELLSVVVVTHTDQDPRRSEEGLDRYEEIVREQLDPVILRLGGDRQVRLVSGSLAGQENADEVTDRITEHLLQWAP